MTKLQSDAHYYSPFASVARPVSWHLGVIDNGIGCHGFYHSISSRGELFAQPMTQKSHGALSISSLSENPERLRLFRGHFGAGTDHIPKAPGKIGGQRSVEA